MTRICETIPAEILCEIFHLLCDKPISLHTLDNSSRFGEFPWAVGRVCKRWREIFLSYPHLWTSLSLQYHSDSPQFGVDRLHEMSRRTLLYLERSEQLPLTITVYTTYPIYSESIENFPRTTWKLLVSCSERWERVDLELSREPLGLILDLLRCGMPIIKSLRLHAKSILVRISKFELYHAFTAAPRLTELELLGRFGGLVFPWSQLTKVKIFSTDGDYVESRKLETILSQLQNVEELRMGKVFIWRSDDDRDRRSIRLPSLRLLAVQVHPRLEILPQLEAPLLEHLLVDMSSKKRYAFIEELSFFIRRSSCHIRRLTLQNCEVRLLPDLMKLLSSVEELYIQTTVAGRGRFLVKHITEMNDGVCLPNLRELEVTCLRSRGDDRKVMTAMSRLLQSEESRLISVTQSRVDVPLEPTMVRISMSFK
jgi:hypothetical protein